MRGNVGGSGVLAVFVVAFLCAAAPALADPASGGLDRASEGVYVGTTPTTADQRSAATQARRRARTPARPSGSSLPFTGFVAILLLAAGLFAIALGAGMRTPIRNH